MEKEARFIIKDDKYSLLIIQISNSNKKTKKGISIYKKNLEINELNENNINIALNKKEKILYSFANLGLYEISGVRCFAYCSEKDIKEVGIISYIKIYQVLNINYIILEDMDFNTASNLLNHFKEQSKSELNKGFFFAQDIYNMSKGFDVFFHKLYDRNKNICHISPNINFCYNYDNISYISNYKCMDITTPIIQGYFIQNNVSSSKKEEFSTILIIKKKEIHNSSFTKDNSIKEIELILCPSNNVFLNEIFHFIFYVFDGYYLDAKFILNDLFIKGQPIGKNNNGSIIIVDIDNIKDKKADKKEDIINKEIDQELNQILGCNKNNKIIIIHNKKEISKIIKNNKDLILDIKYNYEYKGEQIINEFQKNQLLIISSNKENLFIILDNIIDILQYKFMEKKVELKFKIKSSFKSMFDSYKNFSLNINALNTTKLRVEAIDEKYLNYKKINKNKNELKLKEKDENEENEENSNTINIINTDESNKDINKDNNNIIINDNSNPEINEINLIAEENINKKYLYIVTFNAANYNFVNTKEEEASLNKILFPKEVEQLFQNGLSPTFIIFGFQEIVKLNTSNVIFDSNKSSSYQWETKLTDLLLKRYNYTVQYRENLVGIFILIFVKTSEAKNILNMKKSIIKAGFMKTLGNKGYILCEFKYKNKSFAFCSGHLTAGENEKKYKDRTNLLNDIFNHKSDKNSKKLFENDFYFLFGDMNFRIKIDRKDFFDSYEKIKDINIKDRITDDSIFTKTKLLYYYRQKYSIGINIKRKNKSIKNQDIFSLKLFKTYKEQLNIYTKNKRKLGELKYKYYYFKTHIINDELNGLKDSLTPYMVTESPINFLPTYKYGKGAKYYDINKRVPAWTDRILYKKSENIKCIKYNRINIKISDHRPVFGLFEINC